MKVKKQKYFEHSFGASHRKHWPKRVTGSDSSIQIIIWQMTQKMHKKASKQIRKKRFKGSSKSLSCGGDRDNWQDLLHCCGILAFPGGGAGVRKQRFSSNQQVEQRFRSGSICISLTLLFVAPACALSDFLISVANLMVYNLLTKTKATKLKRKDVTWCASAFNGLWLAAQRRRLEFLTFQRWSRAHPG